MRKFVPVLLALCMLASLFTACSDKRTPTDTGAEPVAIAQKKQEGTRAEIKPLAEAKIAASYDEVVSLFASLAGKAGNGTMTPATDETTAPGDNVPSEDGLISDTNTNVQVAGIDEADTVKTDGEYLYILGYRALQIVRADGADTKTVANVTLELPENALESNSESYTNVSEMLLGENTVHIIWQQEQWTRNGEEYFYSITTHVSTYDVADKQAPRFMGDVAQDGSYCDSRLADGLIYLVSTQYLYNISEDSREDAVIPCTYADGVATLLPADNIIICPDTDASAFTVVSAIASADGALKSTLSLTESTDTLYMDAQALYLAHSLYATGESEPYTENQYTVVDYVQQAQTQVRRLRYADGKLTLEQSAGVTGRLLNQFAMDVYNGNLRIATTADERAYSVYTDETYGWSNTVSLDSKTSNRVVILDSALKEIGAAENLAPDESIYAVRFLGEVGYVVTYESIDPIFTLDLSDPTAPKLCSELEVPGVSMYLHPYGEGKLLGFGINAGETGTGGLLLSMFDVTDPAKVKLIAQKPLEAYSSEALNNHKAILVSAQQNIIAFPSYADSAQYEVYAYENGTFLEKGVFELDYYGGDMRGMFIGDYLYLCGSDVVYALTLDTLQTVATLNSAEG